MPDLLPCPFCGSSRLTDMSSYVVCEECDAEGSLADDGVAAWNRRPSPWQPIATAPKDPGLNAIAWDGEDVFHAWLECDGGSNRRWWRMDGEPMNPTHWMPLPWPPEAP